MQIISVHEVQRGQIYPPKILQNVRGATQTQARTNLIWIERTNLIWIELALFGLIGFYKKIKEKSILKKN